MGMGHLQSVRRCASSWRCWRRWRSDFSFSNRLAVRQVLQTTRNRLTDCGQNPAEAKVLLAKSLQSDPPIHAANDLLLQLERRLLPEEHQALDQMLTRRCRGEPLAYVTGRHEFWSMELQVTPDVLIPRSDSETLLEALMQQFASTAPLRILDLCTGSGCLLLAALSEFPNATGVGIDISTKALQVAKQNAHRHALHTRSCFVQADLRHLNPSAWVHQLPSGEPAMVESFDVVLCNPPYISRNDLPLVAKDVLEYEPHLALFPSNHRQQVDPKDPLALEMYQCLHKQLTQLLKPSKTSVVLLEIGTPAQAQAVKSLLATNEWLEFVELLVTANGKPRGLLFRSTGLLE